MNINYQVESYADVQEEIQDLAQANYDEDDPRGAYVELDIDWELYTLLEEAGSVVLVTARDEGELVGYLSITLTSHPHIKDFIQASSDAVYIRPDLRGQSIASDMLTETERVLEESGVSWLSMHFRDENIAATLMDRLGFTKSEIVYSKRLGEK